VGDALFCSNQTRLALGIQQKIANSILVKPNQSGTLTEICALIQQAREGGLTQILSHRHGETCDPFLASLAVSCNTGLIKAGSTCRSERVSKYNELLRIEEELNEQARWIGINAFPRGA
jgi:enolase